MWFLKFKCLKLKGHLSESSNLLVLQDNLPHAEVEHGADVEDEEEGAHHGEGEHGGAGGAAV